MEFVVRHAEAKDAEIFAAILAEGAALLRQNSEGRWPAETIATSCVEAWIAAREAIVATSEGEIAATMLLQWRDLEFWPDHDDGAASYLHKIAVRRPFAGAGAVDALVAWAATQARQHGRSFLRLDTGPWPKVIAIYRRLGFVAFDQIRNDSNHVIRFERSLA